MAARGRKRRLSLNGTLRKREGVIMGEHLIAAVVMLACDLDAEGAGFPPVGAA